MISREGHAPTRRFSPKFDSTKSITTGCAEADTSITVVAELAQHANISLTKSVDDLRTSNAAAAVR